LPGPVLVTKKVISGDCGGGCCAQLVTELKDITAADATSAKHFVLNIVASR
jgi:hypothetical protein